MSASPKKKNDCAKLHFKC